MSTLGVPSELYITPAYFNMAASNRDKASLQLDAWGCYDKFISGDTPGALDLLLEWTQCQKLVNREAKLVMTYKGQLFLDVYRRAGVHMPLFEEWVANVYRPGAYEFHQEDNNQGAWGLLGCVLADSILNEPLLRHSYKFYSFISRATDQNGLMKYEIRRTNSGIWYSYFALAPLFRTAQILGTEIWMLYRPLDWLWQYIQNPDSWPYRPKKGLAGLIQKFCHPHAKELERPCKTGWPANLYRVAGDTFGRGDWRDYAVETPGWFPLFPGVNIFRNGV